MRVINRMNNPSPRIYLCSRVAEDARPDNERVAQALEAAGFDVYVPHRQKPNNPEPGETWDHNKIFLMDLNAMKQSDACVVVGRFGKDCSWELGWFFAKNIPVFHTPMGDYTWQDSPMLTQSVLAGWATKNGWFPKIVDVLQKFKDRG